MVDPYLIDLSSDFCDVSDRKIHGCYEKLSMDCVSCIMGQGVQWSDPNTQSGYGSAQCFVTVCYFWTRG